MAIPEIQAISLQSLISKTLLGIPFVNKVGNIMNFYVNVDARGSRDTQERLCTDYFIEHYFPEYYPLVVDRNNAEFASFSGFYDELRNTISDSLFLEKTGPFNIKNTYKLSLQEGNIYDLKEAYEEEEKLPDFLDALAFFNNERDAGSETGATSFEFANVPSSLDKLTGTISDFSAGLSLFKGIIPLSLDANTLGFSTNRIVNALLSVIYEGLDFKLKESNFFDTDYLTMYFDADSNILRVDYFVLNVTRGETKQAKIGFITNSKYNPIFSDPLALKTVQNYKEIIESSEQQSNLTKQQSITDFFSTLGIEGSFTAPQIGDIPGSITPGNNIFGNRSSDDLIDVSNIQQLEDTFSKLKTKEELLKEIEEAENEETKKNILQAEKAKKLNAGIQIVDTIDAVLNFNVPIFGPNATKEQKIVNQILNQFGIQALAKEAIICLTLGLGATASRITQSVRNTIIQQASSLQTEPMPPSKEINIKRPNLAELFENFAKPFSINGDIKDQIKDIVLGAIANGAFAVIKSLVELIQFNCGAILRGNTGVIDVGSRIRDDNQRAAVSFPNLEELLEAEFAQDGLALEQVYSYFSDVSSVLNPIEVCRLLNSQREVEPSTHAKILDFNSNYPLPQIRNNVNTIGSINSYFARISQYVDTVTFCNDIINNNILQVVENCNICLDEDFYDSTPALDELIRIAEDGIEILPPPIEFLCPDSPNYLENPIATTILPNLFNNILGTTKTYMAGSLEAARTSLLEPTVSNVPNPDLSGALALFPDLEPPTAEMDPAVLNFITEMFDFFGDAAGAIESAASTGVCQDIDNAKIQNIINNVSTVVGTIDSALSEVPGVIEEVNEKVTSIQDQTAGEGMLHTQYIFPEAFKSRFQNAIQPYGILNTNLQVPALIESGSIFSFYNESNDNTGPIPFETISIRLLYNIQSPDSGNFSGSYASQTAANQSLYINYPKYQSNASTYLSLNYNLDSVDDLLVGEIENLVPGESPPLPANTAYAVKEFNPYVFRFVDPFEQQLGAGSFLALDNEGIVATVQEQFIPAYGTLFANLFDYILENGAFSADKINNLKFFKNNANCPPENIGDLFDAEGILDQMKKEFAAAACYDQGSTKDKTRNTLYYGLILMLIQAAIDEFIIKNIVVFSAFEMNSVLQLSFVKEFMVSEIIQSIESERLDGNSVLEREIYNYFDRVSIRQSTINNGGIAHTYPPYDIPVGFELNEAEGRANFPLNVYEPLIRFLVEERLYYTWDSGQRSTLGTINNIIDPQGKNKTFDDVFLEDVIGVYNLEEYQTTDRVIMARRLSSSYTDFNVAIYFQNVLSAPDTPAGLVRLNYVRRRVFANGDLSAPETATLFEINTGMSANILGVIKSSPEYQIFKQQVFNQDAIFMGPLLYNFYLTELFFSDIIDSFRGTKRAIINFMNMTDASTRPPLPDGLNDEYSNTLANNGQQDMDSMAREIFLKFLKETPIQILKGLVELIDPHIAISKIIKDVTADAFLKVSQAITTSISALPASSPIRTANINGEDVLSLLFCLYSIGNKTLTDTVSVTYPPGHPAAGTDVGDGAPLFGPRISLDGVDFKGSIAGMFMAPPSPLGILYLLIELLKIKIDEGLSDDNVDATEPPPSEEC
tara:strand:+ start:19330 stop:24207 length:4878 start_codon:yes stop_codon:yes gene_type:complete